MAEGRSVADMATHLANVPRDHLTLVDTHLLRWNGVSVTPTNDGLVVFIPSPRFLVRTMIRRVFRFKARLVTSLWPAPPAPTFAFISAFVGLVLSDKSSWFRQGPVAHTLWSLDERFNPWRTIMPPAGRVACLAAGVSLASVLALMFIQRLLLRVLLRYRRFMYEPKPSLTTKLWGACLKAIYAPYRMLSGHQPLLYSFQSALPHLPVPPLSQTLDKYVESVSPLMDEDKLAETKRKAKAFERGIGRRLQLALHVKRWTWAKNYVSDWWVKYVYLSGRSSLLINSNYYGMGLAWGHICKDQLSRAAVITSLMVHLQRQVTDELLEPMMLSRMVPLCMAQYKLAFGTTRAPGRECDTLEQFDAKAKHIIVQCRGQLFSLDTFDPSTNRRLTVHDFHRQFCAIEAAAKATLAAAGSSAKSNPKFRIPLLTAARRTKWAELREEYFMHGVNRVSLAKVESAAFIVSLDDDAPEDWSARGKSQLHGNGYNRWCDKSLTVVVHADGRGGVFAEHTWGDAPVIAHLWEMALATEDKSGFYTEDKMGLAPPKEGCPVSQSAIVVSPLKWDVPTPLAKEMEAIDVEVQAAIEALKLKVFVFGDNKADGEFGKGAIKKSRMSPDGFIQMALQLAYRREAGCNCLTYEAGMTRLYAEGRTETVRSLTSKASHFVDLVIAGADKLSLPVSRMSESAKEEARAALGEAIKLHSYNSKEAMTGNGIDRHLFALYVMGKGLGYVDEDLDFLSSALSMPWTMSTSQLPQRQSVGVWAHGGIRETYSPSGGFGPVADTGYGISYMIAGEDHIFFHVSSKANKEDGTPTNTNSERFAGRIVRALKDIRDICQVAA